MDTPSRRGVYFVVVLLMTFGLLTCQDVDCSSLTDPANGKVDHTAGTTLGQTAVYSCNIGYNLVGDSTRTCQTIGEWSGSEPTCQVVDCGSLTDPANGQVNHTAGTTFGQTATYSCNTGYNLVGDSSRTCEAKENWSGSAPTCEASNPTTSKTVGVSSPPYIIPTKNDGAITPVSSNKPPANDGATTTLVIIVVAVVIVLIVVVVVGVVILWVILRAKKRKQRLVISKLHSVKTENQDIEMELKHEDTSEREASSVISTKSPPNVPSKSKELWEYVNQNITVTCGYSELELEQDDSEHVLSDR